MKVKLSDKPFWITYDQMYFVAPDIEKMGLIRNSLKN